MIASVTARSEALPAASVAMTVKLSLALLLVRVCRERDRARRAVDRKRCGMISGRLEAVGNRRARIRCRCRINDLSGAGVSAIGVAVAPLVKTGASLSTGTPDCALTVKLRRDARRYVDAMYWHQDAP